METIIEQRLVITLNARGLRETQDTREWLIKSEGSHFITITNDSSQLCLDKSELGSINITPFSAADDDCYYITRYSDKPSATFYSDAIAQLEAVEAMV